MMLAFTLGALCGLYGSAARLRDYLRRGKRRDLVIGALVLLSTGVNGLAASRFLRCADQCEAAGFSSGEPRGGNCLCDGETVLLVFERTGPSAWRSGGL